MQTRWILAFDSACSSCREISGKISQASGGKLEVLPLERPDVRRWREKHFGAEPPRKPTLIRLDATQVAAFTGYRMALVLSHRLGLRSTIRVLVALGALREEPVMSPNSMNRAGFLRLCAGVAVSTGIVFGGSTPAFAGAPDRQRAREWVAAHRAVLPQSYQEVTALPVSYRQEVFAASPPRIRSRLWVDQLRHYRSKHAAKLTVEQRAVLDRGMAVLSRESLFASPEQRDHAALEALRIDAVRAFGQDEAAALLTSLSPPEALGHSVGVKTSDACTCAQSSDYCTGNLKCTPDSGYCRHTGGCGTAWLYTCDGLCI